MSLHEYKENVSSSPFAGYYGYRIRQRWVSGCITNYDLVKIYENTNTNAMVVNILYGPEKPRIGCHVEWVLEFKKTFSTDLWENEVHYDILKVRCSKWQNQYQYASAAGDEGYDKVLFYIRESAHVLDCMQEDPGLQKFAVIVYGTGPATQCA